MAKKQMQTASFASWRRASMTKGGQGAFAGFCPLVSHLKLGDLAAVGAYLPPRCQPRGPDEKSSVRLAALQSQISDPWAALGDWGVASYVWDNRKWLTPG